MNYGQNLYHFAVDAIDDSIVVIEDFSNRFFFGLWHHAAEPWKFRQLFNDQELLVPRNYWHKPQSL